MSNWELALSYVSILVSVAVVAGLLLLARQGGLVAVLKGSRKGKRVRLS